MNTSDQILSLRICSHIYFCCSAHGAVLKFLPFEYCSERQKHLFLFRVKRSFRVGDILGKLISLYEIALLIRIVLSWVPHNPYNQAVQFLYKITDPVLNPVRKLIPPFRGIDFSPVIVFVGLGVAKRIVGGMF